MKHLRKDTWAEMLNTSSTGDQKHKTLSHKFLSCFISYFIFGIYCYIVLHFHSLTTVKSL